MSASIQLPDDRELSLGGTLTMYKSFQEMAILDGEGFWERWPELFGVPSQTEDSEPADPEWLAEVEDQAKRFLEEHDDDLEDDNARAILETLSKREPPAETKAADLSAPATDHIKIKLPDLKQHADYSCGAIAMQAIAEHFGVGPETEDDWIEALDTDPEQGTPPARIVQYARGLGLEVSVQAGMSVDDLKAAIDDGKPVLVLIQAWGEPSNYANDEDGHYVVVIGHDAENVYFEDPSLKGSRGSMTWEEFEERWHDAADGQHFVRWGATFWRAENVEHIDSAPEAVEKSEPCGVVEKCDHGPNKGKPGVCPEGGSEASAAKPDGKKKDDKKKPDKKPAAAAKPTGQTAQVVQNPDGSWRKAGPGEKGQTAVQTADGKWSLGKPEADSAAKLRKGDKVKIAGGTFSGLSGKIVGTDGKGRVLVEDAGGDVMKVKPGDIKAAAAKKPTAKKTPAKASKTSTGVKMAEGKRLSSGDASERMGKAKSQEEYDKAKADYYKASKDQDAWTEKHFGGWAKSLSGSEKNAIQNYVSGDGGSAYEKINGDLRKGKPPSEETKALDAALAKSKMPEDTVVFRGIQSKKLLDGLKVGSTMQDKAFVSSSLEEGVAKEFDGAAIMEIRMKKGQPGAAMNAGGIGGKGFKDESEILMPRGSGFKVVGMHKEGKSWRIVAEML